MTDRQLIERAQKAMKYSYSPYSHFPVGAAIECEDGTVIAAANIENVAIGSTICAEASAVVKAISEGHRDFKRIAVTSEGTDYCYPCGNCRQILLEFAPDIEVLCSRGDGRYVSYKLSQMMPYSFEKGQLE